jgi:hypothetical protein
MAGALPVTLSVSEEQQNTRQATQAHVFVRIPVSKQHRAYWGNGDKTPCIASLHRLKS